MGKYYIMSVDSFQDAFSRMDSSKHVSYKYECQNENEIMKSVQGGDAILVYRKSPISGISICLVIDEKRDDFLILRKKLEVSTVIRTDSNKYESQTLTEISQEDFAAICREMVSEFSNIGDLTDDTDMLSSDYKQQFKEYILNVLQLKSVRQVRDLEILSDKMYEAGVIDKSIYLVSDVDEYSDMVGKIKGSDLYRRLKSERKDVSPNSGLASDQGMTNYFKFLEYINKNCKERVTGGENILLYGVPGVGKSHEIQENYCDDQERMERVVFHPDYTYSDFVGQILPRVIDGQLKYVFSPGPFTKMLKKAWENPEKEFYLVVEEINRGNAPAIFGEIFQLLDRKSKDAHKYSSTEYGESEYAITNYDVATIVYKQEEHPVRIPSNMWILATMNTADQNVFTLDTAFQRRWNMRHMKNNVMSAGHAKDKIEGSEVQWGAFALVINDMVTELNVDMSSSEDKRLGAYFVKHAELTAEKFPEKVLKYLWDDAFKMDKEALFDEKFKSLESIIETYESAESDKLRAVLRLDVYQKMLSRMTEEVANNQ